MIRICHVTSVHRSNDNRIFQKECVSLAEAGYDVTLVAPGESREERGVHVVGVGPMPSSPRERLLKGAFRASTRAAEALDCDIYHVHDPELLPFALHMARKGKKTVFDSHEHYGEMIREKEYLGRLGRKVIPGLYNRYETHVLRRLDAVVVPCTLNGRNVFEGRAKKTVYVDNLPRLEQFPDQPLPLTPENENTVGYIGGLSPDRGIEPMIRACYRAGARLAMAGIVGEDYLARLRAMPEFACVDFAGAIPATEIPAFCRRFRVGMCLLRDVGQFWKLDNMPTKVYEYMGAGRPLIVSATAPARRLAEEYDCAVCVDPEDVDRVADAIRALLRDPERTAAMGQNGWQAVRTRFNWNSEEEKLLALYEELTRSCVS